MKKKITTKKYYSFMGQTIFSFNMYQLFLYIITFKNVTY